MKKILLLPAFCLFLLACDNGTDVDTDAGNDHDTTVVIHKYQDNNPENTTSPPKEENTAPPEPSSRAQWQSKMDRYHDLLCKEHKNTATTTDRVDLAVLTKELNDMRKNLTDDEKFYFAADMAKAANMETCL